MNLPTKFVPFAKGAPCAVMTRMVAEYLLDQEILQALFQEHRPGLHVKLDRLILCHAGPFVVPTRALFRQLRMFAVHLDLIGLGSCPFIPEQDRRHG